MPPQTSDLLTKRVVKVMNELIGRKVKSKKDFAAALNIPAPSLHRWINGDASPTIQNIIDLVIKFDVSPVWMITGEGPMFMKEKINLEKRVSDMEKRLLKLEKVRK